MIREMEKGKKGGSRKKKLDRGEEEEEGDEEEKKGKRKRNETKRDTRAFPDSMLVGWLGWFVFFLSFLAIFYFLIPSHGCEYVSAGISDIFPFYVHYYYIRGNAYCVRVVVAYPSSSFSVCLDTNAK